MLTNYNNVIRWSPEKAPGLFDKSIIGCGKLFQLVTVLGKKLFLYKFVGAESGM